MLLPLEYPYPSCGDDGVYPGKGNIYFIKQFKNKFLNIVLVAEIMIN